MVTEPRPLSGRSLGQQHSAMVAAGVDRSWRLAWLLRETDRWLATDADDEGDREAG